MVGGTREKNVGPSYMVHHRDRVSVIVRVRHRVRVISLRNYNVPYIKDLPKNVGFKSTKISGTDDHIS